MLCLDLVVVQDRLMVNSWLPDELNHCGSGCGRPSTQNGPATRKTVWQFLTKSNTILPYDLTITILGVLPNEYKAYVQIKTCTKMFVPVLVANAKTWKQPRCPWIAEWMNKTWNICTMKYYYSLMHGDNWWLLDIKSENDHVDSGSLLSRCHSELFAWTIRLIVITSLHNSLCCSYSHFDISEVRIHFPLLLQGSNCQSELKLV